MEMIELDVMSKQQKDKLREELNKITKYCESSDCSLEITPPRRKYCWFHSMYPREVKH